VHDIRVVIFNRNQLNNQKKLFMKTGNSFFAKCLVKHFVFLLSFLIISSFSTLAYSQTTKADFTGKWKLNIEKSSPDVSYPANEILIKQNGNEFAIQETIKLEGRDSIFSAVYIIDGITETYDDIYGEENSGKKWSDDGRTIIIFYEYYDYEDPLFDQYSRYEYTISEDLKTLTFKASSDMTSDVILVYDKVCN
jgi:hypothetical protein